MYVGGNYYGNIFYSFVQGKESGSGGLDEDANSKIRLLKKIRLFLFQNVLLACRMIRFLRTMLEYDVTVFHLCSLLQLFNQTKIHFMFK